MVEESTQSTKLKRPPRLVAVRSGSDNLPYPDTNIPFRDGIDSQGEHHQISSELVFHDSERARLEPPPINTQEALILNIFTTPSFIADPQHYSLASSYENSNNTPGINIDAWRNILNGTITVDHINRLFQSVPATFREFSSSPQALYEFVRDFKSREHGIQARYETFDRFPASDIVSLALTGKETEMDRDAVQSFFTKYPDIISFYNDRANLLASFQEEEKVNDNKVHDFSRLVDDFAISMYGNAQKKMMDSLISVMQDANSHAFLQRGWKTNKGNNTYAIFPNYQLTLLDTYDYLIHGALQKKDYVDLPHSTEDFNKEVLSNITTQLLPSEPVSQKEQKRFPRKIASFFQGIRKALKRK